MIDRVALAKVLHLEELADLDLAIALMRFRAAFHPLDRLGLVLHLDDPVARDQLLGLGERPVDDAALVAGEADARALRARLEAGAVEHDAGPDHLLVEFCHRAEQLLRRHLAGLGILARLDDHHETHRILPLVCVVSLTKTQGSVLAARRQIFAAAADWVSWNRAKLARMPGSALRTPPQSPDRPPSAGCSIASTVSAMAGRTKKRGLNSIMGGSSRSPDQTTNCPAPNRQRARKIFATPPNFEKLLKSL